jgi:serine/threonine protein kinase
LPSDGLPKNLEPLAAGDPATIGPYVLSGKLGSGGMGTVYLGSAADRSSATPRARGDAPQVAIKVIRPELAFDEATRARFHDEMENARKVASFCTAKVLDHGTFENRPYMVTEYIAGTALAEHIAENGPLDSSTLHGFALGVAAALAAIHRTGLVHRDLKPANVLLSLSGPRVIDFGIARAMNTATNHTQTGIVMGSPGWMAPEQLLEEQVTTSADIFAWGCLVAFAGNGTHPFGNGDAMTLGKRVLFAEPQIGSLVSPLDRLVRRALAKEPNRRPTAQDLLLELAGGEDTSNPNDMVSHALHQSWRPNLPPMPPGMPPHPGHQQASHQTMTGMRHPGPGPYQAAPPMPPPAHQTGNFARPQGPPPGHPGSGPPAAPPHAAQGQAHPVGQPPAQHPASTGPIPMVPPPDQQVSRAQPYVPPVPPPPHQPAAPARRRGLVLGAAIAGVALLVALVLLLTFVFNNNPLLPWADDDSAQGQEAPDEQEPGAAAPDDDADGAQEPDGPVGDMPVASADGAVQYDVSDVTCGLNKHNIRSGLQADAEYCVVQLSLTNAGTNLLLFDAGDQILTTTSHSTHEAETPSRDEQRQSLWEGPGVTPGTTAEGELVFILREGDGRPETLSLAHAEGAERTDIAIEHLVR